MAAGQPIRGLVGQGMTGRKIDTAQEPFNFPVGSWTFTPPEPGVWKFVAWGVGGSPSGQGGASGAYGEITRSLTTTQSVTIVVSKFVGSSTPDTTITFPDGHVATAGSAAGNIAGVATGFDINLAGTPGTAGSSSSPGGNGLGTGGGHGAPNSGTSDGGAGAPGMLPYRGGAGI